MRSDKNLMKESRRLVDAYAKGDYNDFNSTLERITLGFSDNPIKVANNIEREIFGINRLRRVLVGR